MALVPGVFTKAFFVFCITTHIKSFFAATGGMVFTGE
jgi:hypothetical protein